MATQEALRRQAELIRRYVELEEPASQEDLRRHLLDTGMTEKQIGDGEIPQGVLFISHRPLTRAEKEYAKTLTR